jgi:hypothetical protein
MRLFKRYNDMFKVGDTVERIRSTHMKMKVGDRARITSLEMGIHLDLFGGIHMGSNLKVVKSGATKKKKVFK